MARYTGPKHKLARREGINILGTTSASLDRRLTVSPGVHGKKRARKLSEYGIQLREKQKLKRIYGLLEKQFRKYVLEAQRREGNTEDELIKLLETRLDNVVYRLGFGKSRNHARQLVSHNHILVNGKKVNVPAYMVKEGDKIELEKKLQTEVVKAEKEDAPEPLSFVKRNDFEGKLVGMPNRDEVANPVNYQLVIEFYSR